MSENDTVVAKLCPAELYLYKKDKNNPKVQELIKIFLEVHCDGLIYWVEDLHVDKPTKKEEWEICKYCHKQFRSEHMYMHVMVCDK
jgi:hypothetical protein